MLKFGNKEFRNLQEQVYKNMVDIQDVMQGATVLADFGIKVIGQVDEAADLPDPAEYEGEYGDAYMVGTEAPYDFYIFTRAFEGQEEPSWFNLGIFPQPGPQGPQGEAGTPVFPEIAVAASATTLAAGSNAKATVVSTGSDSNPLFTFTFEIPQGAQGIQGLTGPQGAIGPMGPRGYINLLRPNADACVAVGEGYMDETGNLQLLVSLDPKEFDNCGQIRGPQGLKGNTGDRGPAGYMSILRATAEDCVELGEGYMNSSGYLMILTELSPRTFTNCGQLRGPQGSRGDQGPTGYVNIIRPNAAACTELYDAYVDSNGNLQILTALPDTFTYGGRIKGETGTAATIRVGTVATGDPGTDVIITNSGSSSAAVLNFTIPQGMPGEDVGINPVIPSGTPTSSLVAIKSGNDYYTVPQGETSLQFNVSVPSGTTATAISTIKDGQNYYTVPTKTSDITNDSGYSAVSGTNDGTNWTSITIDGTTKNIPAGGSGGGAAWGQITGTLSNQTDLASALNSKQDTLISGTNIKTINNQSLLGSGNIDIQGGGGEAKVFKEVKHNIELVFEQEIEGTAAECTLSFELYNYNEAPIETLPALAEAINYRKVSGIMSAMGMAVPFATSDASYDETNDEITLNLAGLMDQGGLVVSPANQLIASSNITSLEDTVVAGQDAMSTWYAHQVILTDANENEYVLTLTSSDNTAINTISALKANVGVRKCYYDGNHVGEALFAAEINNTNYLVFGTADQENDPFVILDLTNVSISDEQVMAVATNITQEYTYNLTLAMGQGTAAVKAYGFKYLEQLPLTPIALSQFSKLVLTEGNGAYSTILAITSDETVAFTGGDIQVAPAGQSAFSNLIVIPTVPDLPGYSVSDIGKYLTPTSTGLAWAASTGGGLQDVSASELNSIILTYLNNQFDPSTAGITYRAIIHGDGSGTALQTVESIFANITRNQFSALKAAVENGCVQMTINGKPALNYESENDSAIATVKIDYNLTNILDNTIYYNGSQNKVSVSFTYLNACGATITFMPLQYYQGE